MAIEEQDHDGGGVVGVLRRHWWLVPVIGTTVGIAVTAVLWATDSFEIIHGEIKSSRQIVIAEIKLSRETIIKRLDDHSAVVRSELAGQTRQLESIAAKQRDDFVQREGRFEELENLHGVRSAEHQRLMRDVYSVLGDFHFQIGRHTEQHAGENAGGESDGHGTP